MAAPDQFEGSWHILAPHLLQRGQTLHTAPQTFALRRYSATSRSPASVRLVGGRRCLEWPPVTRCTSDFERLSGRSWEPPRVTCCNSSVRSQEAEAPAKIRQCREMELKNMAKLHELRMEGRQAFRIW